MTDGLTKISHDTYLKALALFTMANEQYVFAREMQLKMDEMLGLDDGSHADDAAYSGVKARVADFDEALKRSDIVVEPSQA